jgi:exodeoxyribonuclease V alpha subunit
VNEEFFRVTSTQYLSTKYAIFSGIPLKPDSYRVNSGKYIVSFKCETDCLPVRPATGQQWRVKGIRELEIIEAGNYALEQHTYDSPAEAECTLPATGEAFIRFIASEKDFKGIGEGKARALWDAFGAELQEILISHNQANRQRLLRLLSEASVDCLYEGYAKYKNLAHANWMASIGVPLRIQQRILKYHDEQTVQVIKANPYSLMGFGMSFADADNIAYNLKVGKSAPVRLAAAVEFAIRVQVKSGHTYTSHHSIKPVVSKLLGDPELAAQALANGHSNGQFILKSDTGTYHPTAQLMMESVVAKRLKSGCGEIDTDDVMYEAIKEAVLELPYDLTEQQLNAVELSVTHKVSCITGGAGTGKTTVLRTVLKAYNSLGYDIHAVALSGRAAMRLHESIGFITMTIARLLREEPIAPSMDKTKHLLVIDEASMIDLPTMYRIVTHLDPSVRIIFSGDPNQLPPIGCGKVLSDIVEAGTIPNTKLDIVKRQEGSTGIPEYSACINRGEVPPALTMGAITFHETPPDQIVSVCHHLYAMSPETTQIVGATKAMIADLNQHCQAQVNPDGKRLQFNLYGDDYFLDLREGDPILFTKNNYNIGIQNGSLGILTSTESDANEEELSFGTVTLDTGETIAITEDVLDCMELGYAITLHKAQGSQFPRIIVALQNGRIVDRAWLYTAVTRAESEVHIVGAAKDFARITGTISNANRRNSYLAHMLR